MADGSSVETASRFRGFSKGGTGGVTLAGITSLKNFDSEKLLFFARLGGRVALCNSA